jgi:hypothetical protein
MYLKHFGRCLFDWRASTLRKRSIWRCTNIFWCLMRDAAIEVSRTIVSDLHRHFGKERTVFWKGRIVLWNGTEEQRQRLQDLSIFSKVVSILYERTEKKLKTKKINFSPGHQYTVL